MNPRSQEPVNWVRLPYTLHLLSRPGLFYLHAILLYFRDRGSHYERPTALRAVPLVEYGWPCGHYSHCSRFNQLLNDKLNWKLNLNARIAQHKPFPPDYVCVSDSFKNIEVSES